MVSVDLSVNLWDCRYLSARVGSLGVGGMGGGFATMVAEQHDTITVLQRHGGGLEVGDDVEQLLALDNILMSDAIEQGRGFANAARAVGVVGSS